MARNYKKEYQNYQSSKIQKTRRALRNKARRHMMRQGKVRKGDGKDIDHKKPLSKGGSAAPSNYRIRSASSNRSFKRDRGAHMKTMNKAFYGR